MPLETWPVPSQSQQLAMQMATAREPAATALRIAFAEALVQEAKGRAVDIVRMRLAAARPKAGGERHG